MSCSHQQVAFLNALSECVSIERFKIVFSKYEPVLNTLAHLTDAFKAKENAIGISFSGITDVELLLCKDQLLEINQDWFDSEKSKIVPWKFPDETNIHHIIDAVVHLVPLGLPVRNVLASQFTKQLYSLKCHIGSLFTSYPSKTVTRFNDGPISDEKLVTTFEEFSSVDLKSESKYNCRSSSFEHSLISCIFYSLLLNKYSIYKGDLKILFESMINHCKLKNNDDKIQGNPIIVLEQLRVCLEYLKNLYSKYIENPDEFLNFIFSHLLSNPGLDATIINGLDIYLKFFMLNPY